MSTKKENKKLRIRSVTVEFLNDDNRRVETMKRIWNVPSVFLPQKTVLSKEVGINCRRKWVMTAQFYNGRKFIFTNKV